MAEKYEIEVKKGTASNKKLHGWVGNRLFKVVDKFIVIGIHDRFVIWEVFENKIDGKNK